MDFDAFITKGGEMGWYQKGLFLLTAPFLTCMSVVLFGQIFITATPGHHCRIPALENNTKLSTEEKIRLSIPFEDLNGANVPSQCLMYNGSIQDILNGQGPRGKLDKVPCQHGWTYDLSDLGYHTIVSEYDWVCDHDQYGTIAQALFFVGSIIGGIICGVAADNIGRVPVLMATNVIGFAASLGTAFVTSFTEFTVCRFILGLAYDNCFVMMYIIALEYVGPKYRTLVANLSIAIFFTLSSVALPWIASGVKNWRHFCIYTSIPLLFASFAYFYVPESARWLISKGKVSKAMSILRRVFKVNSAEVDEEEIKEFENDANKIAEEAKNYNVNYSVLDLFKTPRLRKITLLLISVWMIMSVCYDGHLRNVGNLGYNIFLTFSITGVTELPADILLVLLLDRWGRRWLSFLSLFLSGAFSACTALVPADMRVLNIILAILGRFSINVSFNIGLQYAAELLPTVVRGQGVTAIHIMGYVASIFSPVVVYLAHYGTYLPLLILGILSIIGGFLSLLLPETLDHELPNTLEEGENFGKEQKFWEFPCIKEREDEDQQGILPGEEEPKLTRFITRPSEKSLKINDGVRLRQSVIANLQGGSLRSSILQNSYIPGDTYHLKRQTLRRTVASYQSTRNTINIQNIPE